MTGNKLLGQLIRRKDFRITWFELHERKRELFVGVKPYKNGCRCPLCDRRCEIVRVLRERRKWRDVLICGMQVIFFIIQRRFSVPLMAGFRNGYLGPMNMPGLPTGLNTFYWCSAR